MLACALHEDLCSCVTAFFLLLYPSPCFPVVNPALPPACFLLRVCVCAPLCVCVCGGRWPTWCRWRVTVSQAPSLYMTRTACPRRHPPLPGLPCPGRTLTPPPTPHLPRPSPAWRPLSTSWTAVPGCGRMTTCPPRSLHATLHVLYLVVCAHARLIFSDWSFEWKVLLLVCSVTSDCLCGVLFPCF